VVCVQLSERSTTPEGFDSSFATNVLGTTALTQRLLPALVAGAPSRVVFVSSGGMYTQPLCLKDMQHAKLQPWDGSAAYAKEKRCQVALAEHLATAWADECQWVCKFVCVWRAGVGGVGGGVGWGGGGGAKHPCVVPVGWGMLAATGYWLAGGVCVVGGHVHTAAVFEGFAACQAAALGRLSCICQGEKMSGGTRRTPGYSMGW
jgi:hypothetical protein